MHTYRYRYLDAWRAGYMYAGIHVDAHTCMQAYMCIHTLHSSTHTPKPMKDHFQTKHTHTHSLSLSLSRSLSCSLTHSLTHTCSCCVAGTFKEFEQRFQKLYRRKAMLHHYQSFLGNDEARSVCPPLPSPLPLPVPLSAHLVNARMHLHTETMRLEGGVYHLMVP